MQEGQDQDFEFTSDNIGEKATTEYFSKVEGGKKNKEKVAERRTRFTRKTLFTILGIIVAIAVVFAVIFVVINISNRRIGKRTQEELPASMIEVQRRTFKAADATGRYYDGIVYLKDLILDMKDSDTDPDFLFEVYVYMARFIYQAGDPDNALLLLNRLEDQGSLTDLRKYWLYSSFIDIYKSENNEDGVAKYQELFDKLNINENFITFDVPMGGGSDEE